MDVLLLPSLWTRDVLILSHDAAIFSESTIQAAVPWLIQNMLRISIREPSWRLEGSQGEARSTAVRQWAMGLKMASGNPSSSEFASHKR
jgi:hypothetical protein